jgi:hypothetical protein
MDDLMDTLCVCVGGQGQDLMDSVCVDKDKKHFLVCFSHPKAKLTTMVVSFG